MTTLISGQNTFVPNPNLFFSGSVTTVVMAFRHQWETFSVSHPIDLDRLSQQGYSMLEFVAKQQGTLRFASGSSEFAAIETTNAATHYAVLSARLYLHNGAWKLKALNDPFYNADKMAQYYGLPLATLNNLWSASQNPSSPAASPSNNLQQVGEQIQSAVQTTLNNVANRIQNTSTQEVVQNTKEVASRLAKGVERTFINLMGNDDSVARNQAQREEFTPLDMVKMQSVRFSNEIKQLHIGLGWKSENVLKAGVLKGFFGGNKSMNVDLDLSVQLLSFTGEKVDTVYFDKLRSDNLAVVHYGDSAQGGNGLQDNEMVALDLTNIPANVGFIAITATSHKGHLFNGLENGYCRVVNQQGMIPLVQVNLNNTMAKSACLVGMLSRDRNNAWEFIALDDYFDGKTVLDLEQNILHWAKFIGQARGTVAANHLLQPTL